MGAVAAPVGIAEMHERYYPYVCNLLRQRGWPEQEVEDTASDIMAKLAERDIIGMFNPDHQIVHRGQQVPANFTTFLTNMVLLYARGKRERLARRAQREIPVDGWAEENAESLDHIVGADSRVSGQLWDDYSYLAAEEFITQTRAYLATIPPRSARDRCDLVALFDEMAAQGMETGYIDYPALQQKFRISATSVYQWVARLRDVLRLLREGQELPASRTWRIPYAGLELTEAEMHEAIHLLTHQGKQPMVAQPLRKHRHKLASAADPRWYHKFAAEERQLFPELEVDPATHKKPAGHVLNAVVHRLQRMVESSGDGEQPERVSPVCEKSSGDSGVVASPPISDTPADLLEAELWKLGAKPAQVDRIMALAQEAYT